MINNYLHHPKPILAEIVSYLSLGEEAKLRMCDKYLNTSLSSLGARAPLSDAKVYALYGFKKNDNEEPVKFSSITLYLQQNTYQTTWLNRIIRISTKMLNTMPNMTLNKDIFSKYPNLSSFHIFYPDINKLLHKNSAYFSTSTISSTPNIQSRKIEIIIEKKGLYLLGKESLNCLFNYFPECTQISFKPSLSIKNVTPLFSSWGLVTKEIADLNSEVVFKRDEKGITKGNERLKNEITSYKNTGQALVRKYIKNKDYNSLFLCEYLQIDTNVKSSKEKEQNENFYFFEALKLVNPVALYANFISCNIKILNGDNPHWGSFVKETVLNCYNHLEKAAEKNHPAAQFLFALIETYKSDGKDPSRDRIANEYFQLAHKAGYVPPKALLEKAEGKATPYTTEITNLKKRKLEDI